MPKKRFSAEQIVVVLRQIEVLQSQGKSPPVACRESPRPSNGPIDAGELEQRTCAKSAQIARCSVMAVVQRRRPHRSA